MFTYTMNDNDTRRSSRKRFWQAAALIALAAIPLVVLARKSPVNDFAVPQAGDDRDIFERDLNCD
jgi:hypothetical protein